MLDLLWNAIEYILEQHAHDTAHGLHADAIANLQSIAQGVIQVDDN